MQIMNITKSKNFKTLRENGLIDETALRNMIIRTEYKKRVAAYYPGMKKREIKEQLAEEYTMDLKNLSKILYSRNNNKKGKVFIKFVEL